MPEFLPLSQTTTYGVQICHSRSEGIMASPIAGPPPQNASLVRLHAPIEFITVYWTAVSHGKPPVLPSHKSFVQNYNRVFLSGERMGLVTPNIVGHIWHAAGSFLYVVVGPEGLSSMFPLAKCPWEGTAATDFYIPSENFQSGITNPYSVPTGLPINPDAQQLNFQMGLQSVG